MNTFTDSGNSKINHQTINMWMTMLETDSATFVYHLLNDMAEKQYHMTSSLSGRKNVFYRLYDYCNSDQKRKFIEAIEHFISNRNQPDMSSINPELKQLNDQLSELNTEHNRLLQQLNNESNMVKNPEIDRLKQELSRLDKICCDIQTNDDIETRQETLRNQLEDYIRKVNQLMMDIETSINQFREFYQNRQDFDDYLINTLKEEADQFTGLIVSSGFFEKHNKQVKLKEDTLCINRGNYEA